MKRESRNRQFDHSSGKFVSSIKYKNDNVKFNSTQDVPRNRPREKIFHAKHMNNTQFIYEGER